MKNTSPKSTSSGLAKAAKPLISKPATAISEFVLEKLASEPNPRRIVLTRALAQLSVGDQRKKLEQVADQLEAAEWTQLEAQALVGA